MPFTQKNKVLAAGLSMGDQFGTSVSVYENYVLIGAPSLISDPYKGSIANTEFSYIFKRNNLGWTERQSLSATDGSVDDQFGWSVGIYGAYAVIGAYRHSHNSIMSGSVYVFKRSGETWTQQQEIIASDRQNGDEFGYSVAIYGDYIFIGARARGAVYVFKREGNTWIETQKLTPSEGSVGDEFGNSVDINGLYAVIGANLDSNENGTECGAVYVYRRNESVWQEQDKIIASNGESADEFGYSVAIHENHIIVGSRLNNSTSANSGAAYIYVRNNETWTEEDILTASDAMTNDEFGYSVDIYKDFAVIGAYLKDDSGNASGAVYVFKKQGSNWDQEAKLTASDAGEDNTFGASVSIHDRYLFIGSPGLTSTVLNGITGSSYFFFNDDVDVDSGLPEAESDPYTSFNIPYITEYLFVSKRKWYYTQNHPGTRWFNFVNNETGWTVDFSVEILAVENESGPATLADLQDGIGIYVNDGVYQETISFLEQEIIFKNAKESIIFDTTSMTQYRLTGKEDRLLLYARSPNNSKSSLIANVAFTGKASQSNNGLKPRIVEDSHGYLHTVWHDDGTSFGQIYYSTNKNRGFADPYKFGSWSEPELIVKGSFGSQNADIAIDSEDVIYVVYESKQSDLSTIYFTYFDNGSWSTPVPLETGERNSFRPRVTIDHSNRVHVIWESSAKDNFEIFYRRWDKNTLSWSEEFQVTDAKTASRHPAISHYLDDIFIVWSETEKDGTKKIMAASRNNATSKWSEPVLVSNETEDVVPDYPDILVANNAYVHITWQDRRKKNFEIYAVVFDDQFKVISYFDQITKDETCDSIYPVLSEHQDTSNIYVVWECSSILPGGSTDPYVIDLVPVNRVQSSNIRLAMYDFSIKTWLASNTGSFDIKISPPDIRLARAPALSKKFTDQSPPDLHIMYESLLAVNEDEYLPLSDTSWQIRDAVYNLEREEVFSLADQNGTRDLRISGSLSTKEIRFGNFSSTLSTKSKWDNIKYYLKDSVIPVSAKDISSKTFNINNISSNDVLVNNYGDAWIAALDGLYFYFDDQNSLTTLEGVVKGKNIRSIVFDRNNLMFAGGPDGLFFSANHLDFSVVALPQGLTGKITVLGFDKNNKLFVGTDTGLFVCDVSETNSVVSLSLNVDLTGGLPDPLITSIRVDNANVIWVGTRNGLSRIFKYNITNYTTNNGLPSNKVNDIAIRNIAIRYIATSNGIAKMIGSHIEKMSFSNNTIWNNNVKSVAWQDPNVLWAGTLSTLNEIIVSDNDSEHQILTLGPSRYSPFIDSFDDNSTFFIVLDEDQSLSENAYVEVYLNGNIITDGYEISLSTDPKAIRFMTPLKPTDEIKLIIRNDIQLLTSFSQSEREIAELGSNIIRISDIDVAYADDGSPSIYLSTSGNENEIKVNESAIVGVPYDKIHFDITPPEGCVKLIRQLGRNIVRLSVEATDNSSGLDKMILSNHNNFTSDGETKLLPIDFTNLIDHDIGINVEASNVLHAFDTGKGNVISFITEKEELYAGSSNPAKLFKLNRAKSSFEEIISYGDNQSVQFIIKYNNKLIVGVSHEIDRAKMFSYKENQIGIDVKDPLIMELSGSSIFTAKILNNILYIGSGSDGKIYSFDGSSLSVVMSGIGSNVYSLASENSVLFAGTGEAGHIYRVDPSNKLASIIHSDSDTAILSIDSIEFNGKLRIFAGTSLSGKILRSNIDSFSFDSSFRTISKPVNAIHTFGRTSSVPGTIYAAVGEVVYFLSKSGSWVWRDTHKEIINDIALDPVKNILYIISDTQIKKVEAGEQFKRIYLKLIDKAGNESDVFDADGNLIDCRFVEISIKDLQGFINENRIIELDENGNVVKTIFGDNQFFSADNIEEEKGVYESEIFNGTNDIVKWDTLSWQATEPISTTVNMFVRSANSKTDILLKEWIGPYDNSKASGVDISFLGGQFMQFKSELTSKSATISPSLHRVLVKNLTSEAIHFFTTNFVLPSNIIRGLLTSEKIIPIAADVVFGMNTANSVTWGDYQIIDENRIFNLEKPDKNMRVGIRLISPSRSALLAAEFDEYGPYGSPIYINTIDFTYGNSGPSREFHFRITLYEDDAMTKEVFQSFSQDDQSGFNIDGSVLQDSGKTISNGEMVSVLYTVPSSANIKCNTFYFVKVEVYDGSSFQIVSDNYVYITGCSASFVDTVNFEFENNTSKIFNYHFRIRFYLDPERTNLFLTKFSGNNRTGWSVSGSVIPEQGIEVVPLEIINVLYEPDLSLFDSSVLYYLTIDAFDGQGFLLSSNAFTFQSHDVTSLIYCGPYIDVPIVKNFALMFELDDGKFVTLNLN